MEAIFYINGEWERKINMERNAVIFVTGGAGYIGSHICKVLSQNGFQPVVYDNLCSGNEEAVCWGPLIKGDIRDRNALRAALEEHKPGAIMHFAALIQVGESVAHPDIYYDNNVFGSWCLLEEARRVGVENMVFSSTAAVYGMPQSSCISEVHPLRPINPYGHTKLAMENMIRDYADAYGLRYAILRYFNAAGADHDAETGTAYKVDTHIIPLLMRVASGDKPQIGIFGTDYDTKDGTAMRDYIHVMDLARAHVLSLRHIMEGKENLILNLGTDQGYSVREVVESARRVTGKTIPAEETARRPGDPDVLVASALRAREVLDWNPEDSNLDTIMETAWRWRQKQKGL